MRPVRTIVVEVRGLSRERAFSGIAKSAKETELSFRVEGKIVELPIKMGMTIKSGQLIARLDTVDYALQVKQLQAQLAQAKAQFKQAKAEYERSRSLYETGNKSKSDLESSRAFYESARAQQDSVQKGLEMARQQLTYCTLNSPVNGVVVSVPVEEHQIVTPGQIIASVTSGNEMEMEIGMPEALIGLVKTGMDATVSFEALSGVVIDVIVSEVGVKTGESATYPVKLRIISQNKGVKAGMVGEAVFHFQEVNGANAPNVIVPPEAVVGIPAGGHYVWIYVPDQGIVTKRAVTPGDQTSSGLQIKSGLEPGEIIVIRGVHRLNEGMKVKLLSENE